MYLFVLQLNIPCLFCAVDKSIIDVQERRVVNSYCRMLTSHLKPNKTTSEGKLHYVCTVLSARYIVSNLLKYASYIPTGMDYDFANISRILGTYRGVYYEK